MTADIDNTEQLENALAGAEKSKKTIHKDLSLLREFDSNDHKDMMVLYHHKKDSEFDCFNAEEYQQQLQQYYARKITVKIVVPRSIGNNKYFLVCLQHEIKEYNSLCQLAFQSKRQFVGYSMLVKKKCFQCNKRTDMTCASALSSARKSARLRGSLHTRRSASSSERPACRQRKSPWI